MRHCDSTFQLCFFTAYIFSRPRKKDTSVGNHRRALEKEAKEESIAKEAPSQPTETMPTHDYDYDYDMLLNYESQTNPPPPMLREPIPEYQQRELFKWMLEEKRKVEPKDHEEKKHIDGDKAILKQFFRAKSIPRF